MVKNGCDHSCLRTQKLTVSEEKNNWCVDKNSGKPKVTLVTFGWW